MSCVCNDCRKNYKVDVMVPKVLWDEIRKNESNINMLCGSCIFKRIEDLNRYRCLKVNDIFQSCPICGSESLKEVTQTTIVDYKTCYNCGCEHQGVEAWM